MKVDVLKYISNDKLNEIISNHFKIYSNGVFSDNKITGVSVSGEIEINNNRIHMLNLFGRVSTDKYMFGTYTLNLNAVLFYNDILADGSSGMYFSLYSFLLSNDDIKSIFNNVINSIKIIHPELSNSLL